MSVVVVGSGAAGLAAALAAATEGSTVTVLESTATIGGTTALSGGVAWLPGNHLGAADDTADQAVRYLRSLALGDVDEQLARTFVEDAPRVARLLEDRTPLSWSALPYPDYHAERPGGRTGGRSLEPLPLDLPAGIRTRIREPLSWRQPVTYHEVVHGDVSRALIDARRAAGTLVMGSALVGALLAALLDEGATVRTGQPGCDLVREGGRVVGVRTDDGVVEGSVVLATGGFERDAGLVRSFLRWPAEAHAGAPGARGDGLRMAMAAGAALGSMSEAWWCPALVVPGERIDGEPLARLVLDERSRPGSLMVDRRGHRFVDEAQNYNDVGRAMHAFDATAFTARADPAWLVVDHAARTRRHLGPVRRDEPDPPWMVSAPDVATLAARIDVDPAALVATVERFNANARRGTDPDFGRGSTAYDRFVGDHDTEHPNLGPLTEAPFHAVPLRPGTLGTKGGPRTDVDGRVLDLVGDVVPGLFAAGNVAASPLGMSYPGAGGTIGPALVLGTRAGEAAARGA